eukprot:5317504-Pleurochrysis_carterae.AAC.1
MALLYSAQHLRRHLWPSQVVVPAAEADVDGHHVGPPRLQLRSQRRVRRPVAREGYEHAGPPAPTSCGFRRARRERSPLAARPLYGRPPLPPATRTRVRRRPAGCRRPR